MVSTVNLAEAFTPATASAAATVSADTGFVFAGLTRLPAVLARFVLLLTASLNFAALRGI
jgi:hypothetical protein